MEKINDIANLNESQKKQLKEYCRGYLKATLIYSNGGKLEFHKKICSFFAKAFYGDSEDKFTQRMDFIEKFRDVSCRMTDYLDKCFGSNFDFENPSNSKLDDAIEFMAKRFIKFAIEAHGEL